MNLALQLIQASKLLRGRQKMLTKKLFMKKTLIALLLVGSSTALFAQNQNTSNSSSTNTNSSTTNDNSTNNTTTPSTTAPTTAPEMNTTTTPPTTDASNNTSQNVNTNTDVQPNTNGSTEVNTQMNTTTNDIRTTSSANTTDYKTYGTLAVDVPSTVRYSFQKENPLVTDAQWYQTPTGQLRVMYKDKNNQDKDVYYFGSSAQSYTVSLPVMQSFTSEDIVAKAKTMFGMSVYDINRVKAANDEFVYHVRLLDNGQVKSVWISEQGTEVAAADVFRSAVVADSDIIEETNTSNNTNNTTNGAPATENNAPASTEGNMNSKNENTTNGNTTPVTTSPEMNNNSQHANTNTNGNNPTTTTEESQIKTEAK